MFMSSKEWGCFLVTIALIGGVILIGAEHVFGWLWHHVSVGWK